MEAKFEIISPDLARQLLDSSEGNRTLRSTVVDKYARDMISGNWKSNGEAIEISESGHLRNGHHRLNAIIKADVSITMLIVRGIADDVDIFDKGSQRTTSDNFKFAGAEPWMYTTGMVALAKFNIRMVDGNSNPSDSEIKAYMMENEESMKFAYKVYCMGHKTRFHHKASVLSALFYAYDCGVSESKISSFIKILNSGFYDDKSQLSAIVLRNWLLTNPGSGSAMERKDIFFKTQEALKSFVDGYPRQKMFKGETGFYSNKSKLKKMNLGGLYK